MKTIGILAICPEPALDCKMRIEERALQAKKDNPVVFLHRTNVEEYIGLIDLYLKGDKEPIIQKLLSDIALLAAAGSEIIIVPNNAVCSVLDHVKDKCAVELINIADATVEECLNRACKTVCILGTQIVIESGLYQQRLQVKGVQCVTFSNTDLKLLNQILMKATLSHHLTAVEQQWVKDKLDTLQTEVKFNALILACSELKQMHLHDIYQCLDPVILVADKAWEKAFIVKS